MNHPQRKRNVLIIYIIVAIAINTITPLILILNLIDMWSGLLLLILSNFGALAVIAIQIYWIKLTTCDLCYEKAKLYWTNFLWDGSRTKKDWEGRKYCLDHQQEFLETYKQKLVESAAKFIFFKEDPYFGD